MDVPNLLERPRQRSFQDHHPAKDSVKQSTFMQPPPATSYPPRIGNVPQHPGDNDLLPGTSGVMNAQRAMDAFQQHHTRGTSPKKIHFELILDEDSKTRARITLRVLINPHDTTESIVTTVKNFYGVYEGRGVSFEDANGNTMIAKYENFKNDMVVYVRVTPFDQYPMHHNNPPLFPMEEVHKQPTLGEPFQMPPPFAQQGLESFQPPSRPTSRLARMRSISPGGQDRRSASSQKIPGRSGARSRDISAHGSYQEDAANDCSDSDGGHGSTTSSKKARSEQFVTAEISLENIMQDGRRMRPKFESSELPLFVPPQVPLANSTSSISPQRRSTGQEGPSPFARPAQRPYVAQQQTLPSPQSFNQHEQVFGWQAPNVHGQASTGSSQYSHKLRDRGSMQSLSNGSYVRGGVNTQGILPTPDPTIASCISDEDVARQLIALGDASNFSLGRTSASAADDALSGVADVASSAGATSDDDSQSDDQEGLPTYPHNIGNISKKSLRYETDSGDEAVDDEYRDSEAMIKSEYDEYENELHKAKRIKTKASSSAPPNKRSISVRGSKSGSSKPSAGLKKARVPGSMSQAGSQGHRKMSSVSTLGMQQPLGTEEEDLSSQPRCQRCRKSKKGCDRQRPCQRCKDAGIGIEGCVSEDEGNGRKGRYGRHMGVVVKKGESGTENDDFHTVGAILTGMATAENNADKNKKRKR